MVSTYFTNVQIHNRTAQDTIDDNLVMENAKRSQPANENIEIMIGLVPFTVIINFFRDMRVLPHNSWQILQDELAKKPQLNRRFPVMGARFNGNKYFKGDPSPEVMALAAMTRKKFVSVD